MLIQYLLQLIYFIFISGFIILIPGLFLLSITKVILKRSENIFLAGVVGFVFSSLLIFVSLFIHNWYFPILLLISINFIYFKKNSNIKSVLRTAFKDFKKTLIKKSSLIVILLFLLGVLGQLAIISPSGSIINDDLVFWSSLGHDGLWHIALIEEIKKWQFPLNNPVFSNTNLYNYHFFSNLLPAFISKFFKLTPLDLFFKFFPLLFSIWIGFGTFILANKLGRSSNSGIWAVFFTYFSGSFGYILTFIKNQRLNGEAIFWSSQVQSSSGNPPQIVSLIIVLAISLLIIKYLETNNKLLLILNIVLIGSLVEFKVYGAIVVFLSLGIISFNRIIHEKKFDFTLLTILSAILTAVLFLPNTSSIGGFLIWEPGWFIRTMIVSTDKLNWIDLELRRQTYLYEHNYKRVVLIELTGFLIFLFGNLGTKFIGLFFLINIFKKIKNYSYQFLFLLSFFAFLMPLLFLQKGVAGNTIQFMQYFLLIIGIFSGIIISGSLNKIKISYLKYTTICLIVLLSIPTQIGLIQDFYSRPAFAKITKSEQDALNFLKDNTSQNSIIFSQPFDKYINIKESTLPIWAWSDTSYIPALTGRYTFIADTEQLDIMGYDFSQRKKLQEQIFNETDNFIFLNLLKENKINFIYLNDRQLQPKINLEKTGLKNVYRKNGLQIWQVN